MNGLPPVLTAPPPPPKSGSLRRSLAVVLGLCLALFLADAIAACVDALMVAFFGSHAVSLLCEIISMATMAMAAGVYALIGLSPSVPKRVFLFIPGFYLATMLVIFPAAIYFYRQLPEFDLGLSIFQLFLAGGLLYVANRGKGVSWPLVPVDSLGDRLFSLRHLSIFVLGNIFVLLPLVVVYVFMCSARAVDHFSEGFMALHPFGFTVQVRKYVRDDGKVIELFPMAHVANANFYEKVAQTFPTNSLILMEGVSDNQNLLTNKISYKRMARSLGLAEQKETFSPPSNEVVRADVDVGVFSAETIDFLNLIMAFHTKGVNAESVIKMTQFEPEPGFEQRLFDDLLRKRNEHLLEEIHSHLPESDNIMVPWGVAHMPGIAREIQKSGFHLAESHNYVVISFGGKGQGESK